jgi:hypothetical protein
MISFVAPFLCAQPSRCSFTSAVRFSILIDPEMERQQDEYFRGPGGQFTLSQIHPFTFQNGSQLISQPETSQNNQS